jgi:hypothetical protein
MAKLSTEKRKKLKSSSFVFPEDRSYPINDIEHGRKALQLGKKAQNAGNLSASDYATIKRKVHAKYPTIGSMKTGGVIPETGNYLMHEGEQVIPAPKTRTASRDMNGNNCPVLGTGEKESDHAHVSKSTPMDLKRKELQNDPMYQTKSESDLNAKREENTRKARQEGHVRPLGGGVAKKAM